jgi:hypothetical protein
MIMFSRRKHLENRFVLSFIVHDQGRNNQDGIHWKPNVRMSFVAHEVVKLLARISVVGVFVFQYIFEHPICCEKHETEYLSVEDVSL